MGALIAAFVPILILMAFPLVLPVLGVWIGALADRIRPHQHSPAEAVVIAAQERTAAWRAEIELAAAGNLKHSA